MTKLESVPANPLDEDSQTLLVAWSRPRLVSTAAIALACFVLTILFAAITMIPPYDIGVYQRGGWAMLLGADPYPPYIPKGDAPFTYPPFAGWLITPLVLFPETLLAWLWSFASIALLAWVIRRTLLLAPSLAAQPNGPRTTTIVISSLALATITDPVWDHLAFGQIDIALMAACLYDLLGPRDPTRTRAIPQGALIGLAAAVKLTPAIFVVYLLLTSTDTRRVCRGRHRDRRNACGRHCVSGPVACVLLRSPLAPRRACRTGRVAHDDVEPIHQGRIVAACSRPTGFAALGRGSPHRRRQRHVACPDGLGAPRRRRRRLRDWPGSRDGVPGQLGASPGLVDPGGRAPYALATAERSDLCWRGRCAVMRADLSARRHLGAPHSLLALGYRGDRTAEFVPVAVGRRRPMARSIVAALFCYASDHRARPAPHHDLGVIIAGAKPRVAAPGIETPNRDRPTRRLEFEIVMADVRSLGAPIRRPPWPPRQRIRKISIVLDSAAVRQKT